MKRIFRGICATLAIVIMMGGLPEKVDADTNQTLVFLNSTPTAKARTMFIAHYADEGIRYLRTPVAVPVYTISTETDLVFTAETAEMQVSVDVLTNLNGDVYYEILDVDADTLTLDLDGTLTTSEEVAAMKVGERRTLSATTLFGSGYLCERTRVLEHNALMHHIMTTNSGQLIYLITAETSDGQASYYYVQIDETLHSDVSMSDLGAGTFNDIFPWDDHWLDVDWAVRAGVLEGSSTTQFLPDVTANRAQIVQVLYNQAGKPVSQTIVYDDVAPNAWYQAAVSWASDLAIVEGDGMGKYYPDREISRQELAKILKGNANVQGINTQLTKNLSDYDDCDQVADWAEDAMGWAMLTGVLVPTEDGLLNPNGTVTRGELATALRVYDGL